MPQFGWHNCPDDVRAQIENLVHELYTRLDDNLIGVYLHGSLALGCFNPLRSDVDLLAVTRASLPVAVKRDLVQLLLAHSGRPQPVEISIIAYPDLVPWRYPTPFDFHYSEDWRDRMRGDLTAGAWRDWNTSQQIDPDLGGHVMVVGRRGIPLYGQPIPAVFPPVPPADYVDSILRDVLTAEFGIYGRHAPAAYIVLNACRTLAYLRTGQVLSKDEGGEWALSALPESLHPFIAAALHAYRTGDDTAVDGMDLAPFAAAVAPELEAQRRF